MDGFDKLEENLAEIEGTGEVSFAELFDRGFMGKYTDFASIEEFIRASDLLPSGEISQESFEAIPDDPWDEWVAENSRFRNWEDMRGKAAEEWAADQLTEGL